MASSRVGPVSGSALPLACAESHRRSVVMDGSTRTRPRGVTLTSALFGGKGLASLASAVELVAVDREASNNSELLLAMVSVVVGLFFLFKAYELWTLHHAGWLLVVIFLGVELASHLVRIVIGAQYAAGWVSLAVAVVTLTYLLQPSVREVFKSGGDR
jgi:hypothetical protein